MPSSSSLTAPQPTTITPSLSPVERVWSKILVIQEQAAEMERKTRHQSRSLSLYEEHCCRIISSFFGRVCRRLSSTSPDSLVNSILNQPMNRSMPLYGTWGKNKEDRALGAYKQERHERGHSSREVTMSGLVINPEYSSPVWMVWHIFQVVQILMDYLKSSAPIITVTTPPFKQHSRSGWERVSLF